MCSLLKLFPSHCSIKLQPLIKPVITSFTTRNSLFDGCLITKLNTTLKSLGYNCIVSFLMRGICICSAVTLFCIHWGVLKKASLVSWWCHQWVMKTGICYTDLGALPQKMRSHKKKKKKKEHCRQMTQQLCNLGTLKERRINLASYLTHTRVVRLEALTAAIVGRQSVWLSITTAATASAGFCPRLLQEIVRR